MSFETLSPNMSLPVPGVGQTSGPQYALDLNSCLGLIDAHNHSPGYGVAITPDGLNISSDLSLQGNNLILARSLRMSSQSAPLGGASDLGCVYVSGVDLYYNDGNGNQIPITANGSIAGTSGSIANLVSPAAATYVSGTPAFVWQSNSGGPTAANMDFGAAILRNITAGSYGLTLTPPTLTSNYTITLPTVPASTKFVSINSSGVLGSVWDVDNVSINFASNLIQIAPEGVTFDKMSPRNNATTGAVLGQALITVSSGTVIAGNTTPTTACTGTLATNAGLVIINVCPDGGANLASWGAAVPDSYWRITRDGSQIAIGFIPTGGSAVGTPSFTVYDSPTAGTHTYALQIASGSNAQNTSISNVRLLAYQP